MGVEILAAELVRAQVRPELVDQRAAGGEIQLGDLLVRDRLQVLDQRPQRVAVRYDQHAPAGQQVGDDRVVEVGQQPGRDVPERLATWLHIQGKRGIAGIAPLPPGRGRAERRRRGLVGPAPRRELPFAVLGQHLGLAAALKCPVVPAVEPPGAAHRDPVAVGSGQGQFGRADRPVLQRGVREGGQQAVGGQEQPGPGRLLLARGGQAGVLPAGEDPSRVPLALPVPQQHQAWRLAPRRDQARFLGHDASSAASPGSVLPWMNSRLAPPPVETWPKAFSSKPSARMAAPVSPPPTTVKAPPPVMAWPTALVPAAYGASSNTPIGPFQKTVPAVPTAAANLAADSGPMSRPIWSAGMASAATTRCGASAAILAATTRSDGSSIWPGAARSR